MSLKPSLVHSCHDQARVLAFIEPLLSAPSLTKEDIIQIWAEASIRLGETRPEKCRCSYRVTSAEAEILVKNGIANYLITEWRYNEERKTYFPAPNANLVWGGKQAEDLGLIRASYAAKTPRVQTVEKAHMERAYLDGRQDEIDRIEVWGEMQREVWSELTCNYPDGWECPFRGRAVLTFIGSKDR